MGKIEPIFGDSKSVLPEILARLGDQPAMFWLDGHWSGGETAGQEDECPVLAELEILSKRSGNIILIDDARLFMSAPAAPHDIAQWPTLLEIAETLLRRQPRPYVQVIDDVIFIVPNNPQIVDCLVKYGRDRSKGFWNAYERGRPRRPLLRGVAHRLTRLLPLSRA